MPNREPPSLLRDEPKLNRWRPCPNTKRTQCAARLSSFCETKPIGARLAIQSEPRGCGLSPKWPSWDEGCKTNPILAFAERTSGWLPGQVYETNRSDLFATSADATGRRHRLAPNHSGAVWASSACARATRRNQGSTVMVHLCDQSFWGLGQVGGIPEHFLAGSRTACVLSSKHHPGRDVGECLSPDYKQICGE